MTAETVTFELNKIIRDKLPVAMRAIGQYPEIIELEGVELTRAHIENVREELNELDPTSDTYEVELCDLLEAAKALADNYPDQEALTRTHEKKREERGGFDDDVFIGRLTLRADDPWVEYYRKNPEKYHEL